MRKGQRVCNQAHSLTLDIETIVIGDICLALLKQDCLLVEIQLRQYIFPVLKNIN